MLGVGEVTKVGLSAGGEGVKGTGGVCLRLREQHSATFRLDKRSTCRCLNLARPSYTHSCLAV